MVLEGNVTGHPSLVEIEQYARAELRGDDMLRVDDHLEACAQCRELAAAAADVAHRAAPAVMAVHADLMSARAAEDGPAPVIRLTDRSAAVRVLRWTAAAAAAASAVFAANLFWGSRSGTPPAATAPAAPTAPARAAATVPDPLTAGERRAVDAAVANGRLERPAVLATLRSKPGVLMGGTTKPTVLMEPDRPVGVAVDEEQPEFSWTSVGDAGASYRVVIYDDNYDQAAASPWIRETRWSVDRPLPRGRTFTWQVTARVDGKEITSPAPPKPEARFALTTADVHERLAALRQRAGASHVALAVLLANVGVLDEADRELTLAAADASMADTVRRLRASLDALR